MLQNLTLELDAITRETTHLLHDGQEQMLKNYAAVYTDVEQMLKAVKLVESILERPRGSGAASCDCIEGDTSTAITQCRALATVSNRLVSNTDVAHRHIKELKCQNMDLETRTKHLAEKSKTVLIDAKNSKATVANQIQAQGDQIKGLQEAMEKKDKVVGGLATEKIKTDKEKSWWEKHGEIVVCSATALTTIALWPVTGPIAITAVAVGSGITSIVAVDVKKEGLKNKEIRLELNITQMRTEMEKSKQLRDSLETEIVKYEGFIAESSRNITEACHMLDQIVLNQLQRSQIDYETLRKMAGEMSSRAFQLETYVTSMSRVEDVGERDQLFAQLRRTVHASLGIKQLVLKARPDLQPRGGSTFSRGTCANMLQKH